MGAGAAVFFFALLSAPTALAALVGNLTVEYLKNPVAVDLSWSSRPRFGWQV